MNRTYTKKDGTVVQKNYIYSTGNNVDKLCDAVNEKFNLKPRQIGSVERVSDMCTNSIVQIGNNYGGFIVLASGDDKTLCNYLKGILSNEINITYSFVKKGV